MKVTTLDPALGLDEELDFDPACDGTWHRTSGSDWSHEFCSRIPTWVIHFSRPCGCDGPTVSFRCPTHLTRALYGYYLCRFCEHPLLIIKVRLL